MWCGRTCGVRACVARPRVWCGRTCGEAVCGVPAHVVCPHVLCSPTRGAAPRIDGVAVCRILGGLTRRRRRALAPGWRRLRRHATPGPLCGAMKGFNRRHRLIPVTKEDIPAFVRRRSAFTIGSGKVRPVGPEQLCGLQGFVRRTRRADQMGRSLIMGAEC